MTDQSSGTDRSRGDVLSSDRRYRPHIRIATECGIDSPLRSNVLGQHKASIGALIVLLLQALPERREDERVRAPLESLHAPVAGALEFVPERAPLRRVLRSRGAEPAIDAIRCASAARFDVGVCCDAVLDLIRGARSPTPALNGATEGGGAWRRGDQADSDSIAQQEQPLLCAIRVPVLRHELGECFCEHPEALMCRRRAPELDSQPCEGNGT